VSEPASSVKVLIVDDDPIYRLAVATMLASEEGVELAVAEAEDGTPALRAIEEDCPDVLLLDLNMPLLNGIEVTKIVKERWPHVRIVLVTSSDVVADREQAEQAGVDAFITKAHFFARDADGESVVGRLLNGQSP
jgi:two-component system, NarL family, nitrate/nitrite response regulator NarL